MNNGGRSGFLLATWSAPCFCLVLAASAQQAATRIRPEIRNTDRVIISGSRSPLALSSHEVGVMPSGEKLNGMTLNFARSAVQEKSFRALIAAQQNPASSSYHHWLNPDLYAARFGMSDADIANVQSWLEQQGFTIDGVARSKNRITFSGNEGQVEAAFGTSLHYYTAGTQTIYAPAADLSIPSALAGVVQSVGNLSNVRPRAQVTFRSPQLATKSNFTSAQSGSHYVTPGDVATIYDVKAAYNAGYTGTGQSIAVVGQSSISVSDIEHFQSAAGLGVKDPTLVLVPNSGTAATVSGDEAESDLDLEWSGGTATGAAIYFVYVGNNSNYTVWDSIAYAVDNNIAPVVSASYGSCETDISAADQSTLEAILSQGASQGQSLIAASGDDGSTACYSDTTLTSAQRMALVVDYPASSAYVTGLGGTEFSGDASGSGDYWQSASGSDVISSALKYIPEEVWNDDSSSGGLSSAGGGASSLFAKPSWQKGVTGIPADGKRDVPDISLNSSPNHDGYLYCSSDSTSTGVTGSCSNGFRDSSDAYLTVAGGTSFAAPVFAGMLAIINQKTNSTGQGVANSTLYSLAAASSTYAAAFHDITSGSNKCTAGSTYCSSAGSGSYAATTGYDQASGLGSVDLYNLLSAWPASSSSGGTLTSSTTTISAATLSPASGAADALIITVASQNSSTTATPTGTLTIVVDGATATSTLSLASGTATYSFSSTTAGSHVVLAEYSGDSTYAASRATLTLTVGSSSSGGSGSFSLSSTNLTVKAGSSGASTITITPASGYTGTIGWSVSTTSSSLSNACYSISDVTVSGTTAVTTQLNVYTSSSSCSTSSVTGLGGTHKFTRVAARTSTNHAPAETPFHDPLRQIVLAGFMLCGALVARRRKMNLYFFIGVLSLTGLTLAGCGSGSSSSNATKGTYTMTITGTDTSTSSISASTTMTLTID